MEKKYKVSVIMGVYNCEKTLKESIDSIIKQTYTDWELIICDDKSSDNSYDLCLKYANDYSSKIKLLKNDKNMRLSYTLNKCIQVATGEYIARMDADDIALPNRLFVQVDYLDRHKDVAWVGSAVNLVDDNGKWGTRYQKENPTKFDIYMHNHFVHPSVMLRKEALVAVKGYTVSKATRRGQDYDLWCKLSSQGFVGKNLREILLNYREDRNSFSKKKFEYRIDNVVVRKKWFKELNIPKRYIYTIYRPIFVGILPNRLLQWFHKKKY